MQLFETLLSSAVIVAVLQYFQGEKNNKLQYITEERAKWRKEIKELISQIEESDFGTIGQHLTDLGKNLNGYGYRQDGEYVLTNIDFFQDMHIWREMHMIQVAVEHQDRNSFEKSKNNLIHYLFLLLKFDWERSKQEIKGEKAIPISFLFFGISLIISVFSVNSLNQIIEDPIVCLNFFISMSSVYMLSWVIYYIDGSVIFKTRTWYLETFNPIMSSILAVAEIAVLYSKGSQGILFAIVAVLIIPYLSFLKKNIYRDYDIKVREALKNENDNQVREIHIDAKSKSPLVIQVIITIALLIYLIILMYGQEIASSILSVLSLIFVEMQYFGDQEIKTKLQKAIDEDQKICVKEIKMHCLKKYTYIALAAISFDVTLISLLCGNKLMGMDSFKNVVIFFWVCIFLNILCLHVIYKKSSIDCIIVKLSKEIHPEDGKELAYVSGREIRNAMYEN